MAAERISRYAEVGLGTAVTGLGLFTGYMALRHAIEIGQNAWPVEPIQNLQEMKSNIAIIEAGISSITVTGGIAMLNSEKSDKTQ